jgi:hypothetical protein
MKTKHLPSPTISEERQGAMSAKQGKNAKVFFALFAPLRLCALLNVSGTQFRSGHFAPTRATK